MSTGHACRDTVTSLPSAPWTRARRPGGVGVLDNVEHEIMKFTYIAMRYDLTKLFMVCRLVTPEYLSGAITVTSTTPPWCTTSGEGHWVLCTRIHNTGFKNIISLRACKTPAQSISAASLFMFTRKLKGAFAQHSITAPGLDVLCIRKKKGYPWVASCSRSITPAKAAI